MADKFVNILPLVLAHEGGYVNHPQDPGGATNKGVTQRVYDEYRRNRGLEPRSVRSITTTEVRNIYRFQYWDMINGDRLPAGIDYAVFDYCVNSGANRAAKDIQREVGAKVDGQIGEETIRKIREAADRDEVGLIASYCGRRMRFLRSLKTWGTFGRGWTRRVNGDFDGVQEGDKGVIDYATQMAQNDLEFPIAKQELPKAIGQKAGEEAGKGTEEQVAVLKTKPGLGALISGSGLSGQTVMTTAEQVKPNIDDTPVGRVAAVIFGLMMLAGALLLLYEWYKKMKEKGLL